MMDRHFDNHAWRSPSAKTGVKIVLLGRQAMEAVSVSSPALGDISRPKTIQPMATSSTNSPLLLIDMVTPWSATCLSKFFKEKKNSPVLAVGGPAFG